jgi:hypothetical protein
MKLWHRFCVIRVEKYKPLIKNIMNPPNMPAQPALKMPTTWGDRILRVQSIQTKVNTSTYIPSGWTICGLTEVQFDADILAFVDAENAVKAKITGAVGLRDAAFDKVHDDLRYIMCLVKGIAFSNENIATTIIESCGYFVKPKHGRPFRCNAAFNTVIPGTIILTSDEPGNNQWQMSKDMVAITHLPSTNTSQTMVSDLTPNDVLYFRCKKPDTNKQTYNWSPWFRLIIGSGGRNIGGGSTSSSAGSMAA